SSGPRCPGVIQIRSWSSARSLAGRRRSRAGIQVGADVTGQLPVVTTAVLAYGRTQRGDRQHQHVRKRADHEPSVMPPAYSNLILLAEVAQPYHLKYEIGEHGDKRQERQQGDRCRDVPEDGNKNTDGNDHTRECLHEWAGEGISREKALRERTQP